VVVMPTDTIYGMVGEALNKYAVERIYKIRNRDLNKPCIILIGSLDELQKFNLTLSDAQIKKITDWAEPTSFIVDCAEEKFTYLHRGTKTLAFRLPKFLELRNLLIKTGPLIAPSANLEAQLPSEKIEDAKKYFGDSVDLYVDGGEIKAKPSRIIKLQKDGSVTIIRE
jgi:L-threonylcarbamoyladenylate synthase